MAGLDVDVQYPLTPVCSAVPLVSPSRPTQSATSAYPDVPIVELVQFTLGIVNWASA